MNMVVAESPGDEGMACSTHTRTQRNTHRIGSVHPFFVSPQGRKAGAGPTYTCSHVGSSHVLLCLDICICLSPCICVCAPAIVLVRRY